ncbi:hypothetical protein H6P81_006273 [Aristolochia fimbriata]|uniref:Uncharacterized protein n=1 Tax=Aristolochia fimbriata TaxID=158543 RepID=A0AAV7EY89_ARIFI|nr:hypothetical protein H6P81_006273 [Aristolochia fimbriata]
MTQSRKDFATVGKVANAPPATKTSAPSAVATVPQQDSRKFSICSPNLLTSSDIPPAPTAHAALDELVSVAENVSIDSPASDSILKETLFFLSLVFSPKEETKVMETFDTIIKELTGGLKKHWISHMNFTTFDLTTKYYAPPKVVTGNWMLSRHKTTINKALTSLLFQIVQGTPTHLGNLILEQIFLYAEDMKHWESMVILGLIYSILQAFVPNEVPDGTLHNCFPELKISTRKVSV